MRLRELKCENCGATIKIDENVTKAKCEFCKTEFAVEDAYHDGYKFEKGRMKAKTEQFEKSLESAKGVIEPIGKIFAAQYIISAIVGIVIFITVVVVFIVIAVKQSNSFDEYDINRFNSTYEMHKGTKYGSALGRLIDEVITNNKKDEKHQITLEYKETSTKDPEKMKKIKKELDDWTEYEVSFEYDKDGFIYIVAIEE